MRRAFELRDDVTAHDATYVALAEQLDCELLTADPRLAASPNVTCQVAAISTGHRGPEAFASLWSSVSRVASSTSARAT